MNPVAVISAILLVHGERGSAMTPIVLVLAIVVGAVLVGQGLVVLS
jgi:hypothetical protein